ncbi:hypothetical protein D3C71_2171150 [compost metagenome]
MEETNAAIEQTEAQAGELDRIVEVFRVSQDPAPDLKRPSPAPRPKPAPRSIGNTALASDWEAF